MKKKSLYVIFMVTFAFFIILNFGIHIFRTNEFNMQVHTIEGSAEGDYSFSLTPQNGKDISWTRTATINGEAIDFYACSFEGVFTNANEIEVSNWTLRMDINNDCYVNAAWCGVVEVHQTIGGEDKVQTLDLRKFDKSEVTLTMYEDGDIFLFPLSKGDYLIYYPNAEAKELPIAATVNGPGQVGIGIIFYWEQGREFDVPEYSVTYQKHKGYAQGKEAVIFIITSALWILLLVVGIAVNIAIFITQKKAEVELSKKDIAQRTSEKMLDEMIKTLASSIDAKDAYTHGHSERVAQYALMLAQRLNLSSEECKEVFYAGLVHDVGKIAIPDTIINKPGKLTDDEFALIKSHPERGAKILLQIEDMPYLSVGAKFHHERYDGKGYPSHAKGEEIPLLARIIAVADSYDAMTSKRSYRNTLDQSYVKQEIWKGMGTQFDPLVAKQMISLIDADINYDMREKTDETYEIIDEIKTNEFWKDYNPKSINEVETVMSDASLKYFAEFILTVDHWINPVKIMDISDKETTVTLLSKTNDNTEHVWDAPTAIIYTSEDGAPLGKNYKELAVFMCAGYSWKTGITRYEENTLVKKEAFGDWNNWIAKNKEGLLYQFSADRHNNIITLKLDNDLLTVTGRIELPEDFKGEVYMCVSGENCTVNIQ